MISCIRFCDFLDHYSNIKLNNQIISPSNNNSNNSHDYSRNINLKQNKISESSREESSNLSPSPTFDKIRNLISNKNIYEKKNDFSHIKKSFVDPENHFRFFIPVIISTEISNMKMRDLVQLFRSELLIYDLENCFF